MTTITDGGLSPLERRMLARLEDAAREMLGIEADDLDEQDACERLVEMGLARRFNEHREFPDYALPHIVPGRTVPS